MSQRSPHVWALGAAGQSRRRALGGLSALVFSACGGPRAPEAPPPAPTVGSDPADAIPGDLDLVLWLDWRRITDALGAERVEALLGDRAKSADKSGLVRRIVARADAIWLALRPGLDLAGSDSVLVVVGTELDLPPSRGNQRFKLALDLGGNVLRFDVREPNDSRFSPVRLYAVGRERAILVSSAELDAVERTFEQGQGTPRVSVPRQGDLALAARLPALRARLAEDRPGLSRLLDGGEALETTIALKHGALSLRGEVRYSGEPARDRAADRIRALAGRLAAEGSSSGQLARRVKISAVGPSLVVRIEVPLERLLGMAQTPGN